MANVKLNPFDLIDALDHAEKLKKIKQAEPPDTGKARGTPHGSEGQFPNGVKIPDIKTRTKKEFDRKGIPGDIYFATATGIEISGHMGPDLAEKIIKAIREEISLYFNDVLPVQAAYEMLLSIRQLAKAYSKFELAGQTQMCDGLLQVNQAILEGVGATLARKEFRNGEDLKGGDKQWQEDSGSDLPD